MGKFTMMLLAVGLIASAGYRIAQFTQDGNPTNVATGVFCGVIGLYVFIANAVRRS